MARRKSDAARGLLEHVADHGGEATAGTARHTVLPEDAATPAEGLLARRLLVPRGGGVVVLPSEVRRVVILADNDGKGAGLVAAEKAAARLHGQGRRVWIANPATVGEDFNDLLQRHGPEVVRAVVEAAVEWQPNSAPTAEPSADTEARRREHWNGDYVAA